MQGYEWHVWQGQKEVVRTARYPAGHCLYPQPESSQIIHRRFIHILNKKNISNYIQPFLI